MEGGTIRLKLWVGIDYLAEVYDNHKVYWIDIMNSHGKFLVYWQLPVSH